MQFRAAPVLRREGIVFARLWHASAFSAFAMPVLFLAAMGVGLGDMIDERRAPVAGLGYLDFVAPGLLVAAAVLTGAAFAMWPIMAGMKWMRTFHGMVATPVRPADVYDGQVAWMAARTAMSSSAFLVVAALLGGIPSAWGLLAVPVSVLTCLSVAAPLAAFAATQDDDTPFIMIQRLGVMPLFLFSGTFFPISALPSGLRPIRLVSPLWHGVELARSASTGHVADWGVVLGHAVVLAALVTVGVAWGHRTFTRRLTP